MSHHDVLGAVILARNGDRTECYQHPVTQKPGSTASTPLGEVQAFQLGQYLRNLYLDSDSSSYIRGIHSDLVDLHEVAVRVKVGGEGAAVFDSATALLQGLFPPNPNHRITLANETTVMAPLNGYQYIPVETVEPSNDRSLEPWTDCPAFEKHVSKVHASSEFKAVAKKAQPFFNSLKDFAFGRELSLENMYNVYDFVSSQLVHNKTYAHRLPPTFIEQARGFADYRENAVYSDSAMGGIGNIASRTALSSILKALQRIAFNGDPLQLMVIETTYQPFISFFHQADVIKLHPELQAIPDFGSAIAIELRRAPPPDARDFLRFKFRNGTTEDFHTIHVFNHREDIPLTEFIYRLENSVINSNREWAQACSTSSVDAAREMIGLPESATTGSAMADVSIGVFLALIVMLLMFVAAKAVRRRRAVRLAGPEESLSAVPSESGVQKAALRY
ncbi:phosphoglycerate mutase-like protein [Lentinus tigrinus ALCF2SS1-7]|uniref:Phosphoglycerate mutase-like protein n=1 Tax=Lentinus tigrinus ALCF2SS1-6 TaxID=1328759 RepID=A0A5C2S3M8_9APHY|nr:phosphoglycerate mutase-like protein [Lentinus tigrinus ALCF2SS1-6]RPD72223.1 phosphoglycerate mutase-like protein [Lentinus tigrinus ALCF2SS1-7]